MSYDLELFHEFAPLTWKQALKIARERWGPKMGVSERVRPSRKCMIWRGSENVGAGATWEEAMAVTERRIFELDAVLRVPKLLVKR